MKYLINELLLGFSLMNHLMGKGLISYKEARKIIWSSLPEDMPDDEKKEHIDSIVKKSD